jgi:dynein heavy chain, axonemal
LKKCFRGIAKLSFTEDMAISSLISAQGEEVELVDAIDTASARGQVEQWMKQLETGMKESVKKVGEMNIFSSKFNALEFSLVIDGLPK